MTDADRRKLLNEFEDSDRADNTVAAYGVGLRAWKKWCAEQSPKVDPWNPSDEDVAVHFASMAKAGAARKTVSVRRSALKHHFTRKGKADPTAGPLAVRYYQGAIRKTGETHGQATALRATHAERIYGWEPKTYRSPEHLRQIVRGKVAIRVMRDALLRVSEAAALDWSDVRWPEAANGKARIFLRRSKTDQMGDGVYRTISVAATRALREWAGLMGGRIVYAGSNLDSGVRVGDPGFEPASGSVFGVGGQSLRRDIKRLAVAVGLAGVSSHSCRIGMAIDLHVVHGLDLEQIRNAGRWQSLKMVRRYLKQWLDDQDPAAETFEADTLADVL